MKIVTSLAVVAASLTTVAAGAPPVSMDQSAYSEPAQPWVSVDQAEKDRNCRDRIQHVRDTNGHPEVRRETASPDNPLLIAAVDHRIGGCSVMVMRHDTSDIRPLPKIENNPEFIPAR